MSQPLTERPLETLPPSLPPQLSPRAIARARRRQAAGRAWSEYRRNSIGMVGLAILVLFIAMAVFAPLIVPASELDVTRATGTPFSPPAASSRWGPTGAAARCSP
jgi:peptide/nickel transport system permease protein